MDIKIYKIVNDINDKIYVGKTSLTIEERFKQHKRDSAKEKIEKRPLYNAMKKYGIEHFHIELIEECNWKESDKREKYWIKYYDSYKNGYNATLGGDGKILYDYEEIEFLLKERNTTKEICEKIGCSTDIVYNISKISNIPLTIKDNELKQKMLSSKRKVAQYDLNGKFIQIFESYNDAGKWLLKENKIKNLNSGVRSHIGEAAKGKRKTAYKYIWKNI